MSKLPESRSGVQRAFDTLLLPNYAVAGFFKGLVDDKSENNVSPLQGMWEGVKAGNPFGDGYAAGRHTFSEVLGESGWKPTSTIGKIAKGVTGFALDVALDPTTYLTGGLSAAVKGSGKAGLKAFSKELAPEIAARGMTPDIAKGIIEKRALERGITLSADDLVKDSERLTKKFNDLIGLRDEGRVTFGLSNMPFVGEKLFGKNMRVGFSDAGLRQFSDASGISSAYALMRKSIYGTQFGRLFSNNAKMYQLSKTDPGAMYDLMKHVDIVNGLNLDKAAKEKSLRDMVKRINADLTPAEMKQALATLQNPATWKATSTAIKFAETQEAAQIRSSLEAKRAGKKETFDKLMNDMEDIKTLTAASKDTGVGLDKQLTDLRDEYRAKLVEMRNVHDLDSANRTKLIKSLEDEIKVIDETVLESKRVADDVFDVKKLDETHQAYKDSVKAGTRSNEAKYSTIESLSKFLFDDTRAISKSTYDKYVDDLVEMAKSGATKSEMLAFIEMNADKFSGRAATVYPFVANQVGYGTGTKFKNWDEFYHKRLDTLIKKAGRLSAADEMLLAELQQANLHRMMWLSKFHSAKSMDDVMRIITDVENAKMYDDFASVEHLANTTGRTAPRLEEQTRNKIADDLRASEGRQYDELQDKSYYNLRMTNHEKDQLFDEFASAMPQLKITKNSARFLNLAVKEAEKLTQSVFKRPYSDLTQKQKDLLFSLSIKNANNVAAGKDTIKMLGKDAEQAQRILNQRAELARLDALEKKIKPESRIQFIQGGRVRSGDVVDLPTKQGEYAVGFPDGSVAFVPLKDVTRVVVNGAQRSADDLIAESRLVRDVVQEKTDIYNKINNLRIEGMLADSAQKTKIGSLLDQYIDRSQNIKRTMEQLEERHTEIRKYLYDAGESVEDFATHIDKLGRQIDRIDEWLASDNAFEIMVRSSPAYGDDFVKSATKSDQPYIFSLEAEASLSDKVKEVVAMFRAHMDEWGAAEVSIGKLKAGQLDNMTGKYVSHILTAEGEDFFNKFNIIVNKETGKVTTEPRVLTKDSSFLTQDLGYGNVWNPYAQSRTIKNVKVDDEWIKDPTIEQINELFAPLLQGKNAFSENIADIFLARGLKNSDLMYDNRYVHTMLNVFGKQITDPTNIDKGYLAVANIGAVRDFIKTQANDLLKNHLGTTAVGSQLPKEEIAKLYRGFEDDVMRRLGLTKETVGKLATPLMELTPDQIAKFNTTNPALMRQVNDAIVQKANQARKIQLGRDMNSFLRIYDKFTHWFKLNQTTVMPSFHARNKMSNMFLNWLAVGNESFKWRNQRDAWKAITSQGHVAENVEKFIIANKDGTTSTMHWNEAYELGKIHGVVDEGFFAADLGAQSASKGVLPVKPKYDPTDTANFFLYRMGGQLGSRIENTDRLIHFVTQLRRGMSPEDAADSTRRFLFDYSDITAFEANVMKRVIPFYVWLRKNSRLQLSQMLENPGKYQLVAKELNGVEGMVDNEDRINFNLVNDFAQDWIQLPMSVTNEKGKTEPVLFNPNLPFQDLSRIPNPLDPVGSAKGLFTQMNPLLKIPAEQMMNQNMFFESPIVKEGQDATARRLDHVLSQLSLYGAGKDLVNKSGLDWGLELMNNTIGIKMLSYDYDSYKFEMMDKLRNKEATLFEKAYDKIVDTVNGTYSWAVDGLASYAESTKPTEAGNYTGALRPISSEAYSRLSDEEKKKYTPPSVDAGIAYNLEAVALEKAEYQNANAGKKLVWSLIDAIDVPKKKSEDYSIGHVTNVVDGDTFHVNINGKTETVRLLLVDTPETVDPRIKGEMPFGREASDYAKKSLIDKDVRLIFDGTRTDKYGRMLAYVEVDDKDYNKEVLSSGLGTYRYNFSGNYDRLEEYLGAESNAYRDKKGIWQLPGYSTPGVDVGYNNTPDMQKAYADLLKRMSK
jgi:endonuclease YncB( thermonuclease family)